MGLPSLFARRGSLSPPGPWGRPCPDPSSAPSRAASKVVLPRGLPPALAAACSPGNRHPIWCGDPAARFPPPRGAAPCGASLQGANKPANFVRAL